MNDRLVVDPSELQILYFVYLLDEDGDRIEESETPILLGRELTIVKDEQLRTAIHLVAKIANAGKFNFLNIAFGGDVWTPTYLIVTDATRDTVVLFWPINEVENEIHPGDAAAFDIHWSMDAADINYEERTIE